MKKLLSHKTILTVLILIGAVLRFTNLFWGEPWWFHPDERNVASAVARLSFPDQMDPEFFAYGTFPIYLIFSAVKFAQTWLGINEDPFSIAIKVSRIFSALLSTALIPLMYWITKQYFELKTKNQKLKTSLITALLTTFTVGFIQFAHFGTFEIWLTVFYLLLLVCAIELSSLSRTDSILPPSPNRGRSTLFVLITGLLFGLAVGTKITSLVLLPGVALALLYGEVARIQSSVIKGLNPLKTFLQASVLIFNSGIKLTVIILTAFLVFVVTNPFAFNSNVAIEIKNRQLVVKQFEKQSATPEFIIDTTRFEAQKETQKLISQKEIKSISDITVFLNPDFIHSINTEGAIARGDIQVFYTRHFTDTVPGLYQFQHVYPFILSWPVLIFGLVGMLWIGLKSIHRTKSKKNSTLPASCFLLLIWFTLQTVFNFTLYVKWTRYTVPTLPFIVLASVLAISKLTQIYSHEKFKNNVSQFFSFSVSALVVTAIVWHTLQGLAFSSIYLQPDPRIQSAIWASQHLSSGSKILSEVWDLGIIPFNPYFMSDIKLFNFYELDDTHLREQKSPELKQDIQQSNIFVILSRRIWKHSLDYSNEFPQAAEFYQNLFTGKLGYVKTIEYSNSPAKLFDLLTFSQSDETNAEETFSVFDHPTVQIWQKPQY